MAKKKIGIKYCGGCNPHYERVEMIQRVQSLLKNRFIFLRYDQKDLDALVLVNGCPRSCSSIDFNQTDVPSLSVTGESDFENLMNCLRTFDKKGNLTVALSRPAGNTSLPTGRQV
jgi:hypothetical protein